jgi:circadian clock protein KaiC
MAARPMGMEISPAMLETGVPNLDRVLGGGIPEGDVLLLMGPAGSGKTTLSSQLAFHAAASGKNAIYVSTLSESPGRLVKHLRSFSFFDEQQVGRRLFLLNVYPFIKQGTQLTIDALIAAVKERQADVLILDGLSTIRDVHAETSQIRTFIYELAMALSAVNCTTIITSELMPGYSPELNMSDGIVTLGLAAKGALVTRTLQAQKTRGREPLLGFHGMRIDANGVTIHPRIESFIRPALGGLSAERLSVGLPELDQMLGGGGLLRGSVTLVTGSPGTGKTLIGLQYIVDGARRGEKGLIVGFRESPQILIDKARLFGIDLDAPIRKGLVSIFHQVPIDLPVDEALGGVVRRIEAFGPKRLVLDSVGEIERAVFEEWRKWTLMVWLAEIIRGYGLTGLVMRELSQVAGPELDFSDSPLAVLGENLILLRYVEFRSELYRILSILKLRDSDHDRTIRQYEISTAGLRVLARLESAEGILSGIARLPSEMRVKRAPGGES